MTSKLISRREALAGTAAALSFSFFPARVLGRGRAVAPSDKLNIAMIGPGGRGRASLQNLPDENIVALCDVDWRTAPSRAQRFPAIKVAEEYPKARRFNDYRRMLEEIHKDIDAVVVACPDHSHAHASIMAMKMGKHVYCEKPMAHDIFETNAMVAAEKKYKVTTQVGHQGHGSDDVRSIVEWVRNGAIGAVKDVYLFEGAGGNRAPRAYTFEETLKEEQPVPADLDWDLWLGPAPFRRYNSAYLPGSWRRWVDFGTGVMGDFNSHYLDPVAWALDLGLPETIEAKPDEGYDPSANRQTYPNYFVARLGFAAKGERPAVNVTWFANSPERPPRPEGWKADEKLPDETGGGMIVGTQGSILYGKVFSSFGDKPTPGIVRLFPDELDKSYKRPDKTIPRVRSHWAEWVECCKAGKPAGAHFGYSQVLAKTGVLANIAIRNKGKIMRIDTRKEKFINDYEANKLFRRSYRDGWPLPA